MRPTRSKVLVIGPLIAVVVLLTILRIISVQSVRCRARSITSIHSAENLVDLIGKPDAIAGATPDIFGIDWSLCLEYNGRAKCKYEFNRSFPFIKRRRFKTVTRIHMLGKDRLTLLAQINARLDWGPWVYNHAVIVQKYETSPDPKDSKKYFQEYRKLVKHPE